MGQHPDPLRRVVVRLEEHLTGTLQHPFVGDIQVQDNRPNLTLAGEWGRKLTTKATETPRFGRPFMKYSNLLPLCGFMYESGAVLGRALGSKVSALEPVLGTPAEPGQLICALQKFASDRLAQFPEQPRSFGLFILTTELRRLNLSLDSDMKSLKKMFETKADPKVASEMLEIHMAEGIGFGSLYPVLTEQLQQLTYDDSMKALALLGISADVDCVSLEEFEHSLLTFTAGYVNEFYPAQISLLGLKYLNLAAPSAD